MAKKRTKTGPATANSSGQQDVKKEPLLTTAARAIGSALGTVAAQAQQVIEVASKTMASSGSVHKTLPRPKPRSKRARAKPATKSRDRKKSSSPVKKRAGRLKSAKT